MTMGKRKAATQPKLDLADFERRIRIRPLRIEDFDAPRRSSSAPASPA